MNLAPRTRCAGWCSTSRAPRRSASRIVAKFTADLAREVKKRWPEIVNWRFHFHNGRGLALASTYAALDALEAAHDEHVVTVRSRLQSLGERWRVIEGCGVDIIETLQSVGRVLGDREDVSALAQHAPVEFDLGFTRAAAGAKVSQPTLSSHVAALEAAIGLTLR